MELKSWESTERVKMKYIGLMFTLGVAAMTMLVLWLGSAYLSVHGPDWICADQHGNWDGALVIVDVLASLAIIVGMIITMIFISESK
jgi:hypothetical protein